MLRRTRTLTRLLAATTLGAAIAPSAAHASMLTNLLHLHLQQPRAPFSRATVTVVNRAVWLRDVQVDGKTYTLRPDRALSITAPVGTPVYAGSTGASHRPGDLLFKISREETSVRLD